MTSGRSWRKNNSDSINGGMTYAETEPLVVGVYSEVIVVRIAIVLKPNRTAKALPEIRDYERIWGRVHLGIT